MKSINFVLLGDPSIAGKLGKKGTSSDITIFDKKIRDYIFTWTVPTLFPDKIQPLIQAINMAEYAILHINKVDKYLGEQLIALDSVDLKNGFILYSYEVDESKIKSLIKNTSVSAFQFLSNVEELQQEITKLEPLGSDSGPVRIEIDHAFDVKGVGTVILGVIKQGRVHIYDELTLLPGNNKVMIKSIQMHDDPVQEAASPARVGLAIKGIHADDISRGDVLAEENSLIVGNTISIDFQKSPFYKGEITANQSYLVATGLQIKAAKTQNHENGLGVIFEKQIVYEKGQKCTILKPDSQGTRIIGSGIINN